MEYLLHGTNVQRYSHGTFAGVEVFADSQILDLLGAKDIGLHVDNGYYCRYRVDFFKVPSLELVEEADVLPVAIVHTLAIDSIDDARVVADLLVEFGWRTKLRELDSEGRLHAIKLSVAQVAA